MKKTVIIALLVIRAVSVANALSKEEFLKLSPSEKLDFAVVAGISSEYAIPREEFMKLSLEVRRASALEFERECFQYAIKNIGKKQKDLDVSKLYDLSMPGDVSRYAENIVNYMTIGGLCESHFKVAEYYYKDYLEWKKSELGQPSLVSPRGSDESGLSYIVGIYSDYDMYKEWDALYADYNEFWWKRYAASECKQLTSPGPDCVGNWLKNSEGYQGFLKEWKGIKSKAKTIKPKPLSIQVRAYEDFYSSNVKKVLGAVEYYRKNDVKFMVEKAAKHKNPVVAKKAKEYLDNWDKGLGENKETHPTPEKK